MDQTSKVNQRAVCRGQLYFADLGDTLGSEQSGTRPVLVVQNDMGNKYSPTTIVAPITSQKKKALPTHLTLPTLPDVEEGSVLLLEQLRTIDKVRLGKYIGCFDRDLLHKVDGYLAVSLGFFQRCSEPLVMTLCKRCANNYRDARIYTVRRASYESGIKEPCLLCSRPGFDYEVTRKGQL